MVNKMVVNIFYYYVLLQWDYRILGNFQSKIFSLFLWISLKPRKFNYMNIFQ